jgi:hypothetical protein
MKNETTSLIGSFPDYGVEVTGLTIGGESGIWRHGDYGWYPQGQWGRMTFPHDHIISWMPLPPEAPVKHKNEQEKCGVSHHVGCAVEMAAQAEARLDAVHRLSASALQASWLYSGKDHVEKLMREIAAISSSHEKQSDPPDTDDATLTASDIEGGGTTYSGFIRARGARPERHQPSDAEATCGNCKHLKPDYSHPCTDGCSLIARRGWICAHPELGLFSGWSTDGGCESHDRICFPDASTK